MTDVNLTSAIFWTSSQSKNANLTSAKLDGANLSGVNLSKVDLEDASLTATANGAANLAGVTLTGTILKGADLTDAIITGAVDLTVVDNAKNSEAGGFGLGLTGLDLSNADLTGANLSGIYFINGQLDGATLKGANLSGAYLQNADLHDAKLQGADLTGATLKNADFKGAEFGVFSSSKTDVSGADLRNADLSGTDAATGLALTAANVTLATGGQKVELTGANLSFAKVDGQDASGLAITHANLSNIDLSSATVSELSPGTHAIYFKVQDNNGVWSEEASSTLVVENTFSPVAYIDMISPNPATTVDDILFVANGEDSDGVIIACSWRMDDYGVISDQCSFGASEFEAGTYVFYLQVQDNDGLWSEEVTGILEVNE